MLCRQRNNSGAQHSVKQKATDQADRPLYRGANTWVVRRGQNITGSTRVTAALTVSTAIMQPRCPRGIYALIRGQTCVDSAIQLVDSHFAEFRKV